jgi:hypothetical protein
MKTLLLILIASVCCTALHPLGAVAAGPNPIAVLQRQDAYLSPKLVQAGVAATGDEARLEAAARQARGQGVPEKFLLVASSPYAQAVDLAHGVRDTLGFSGVLVVVQARPRHQIAISSDKLSQSEESTLAARAAPRCPTSYTDCAIFAGQQAVDQVKADQQSSSRSSSIFWLIVVGALVLIGLFVFGRGRRGRASARNQLGELQQAASNTLAQADTAIQTIEAETNGGRTLSREVRAEYDRALGLRDTARGELERGGTPAMLTQANQDAAQAVLGLQGVMRSAGIDTPLNNPLDAPAHRCFYCGRTDRPPYTTQTISDGRGNSMEIEVCAVDEARLQQGQKPQVATVPYGGAQVPWYAVPGNPWYYAYGGPTWQYWLPMMFGMELGGLLGGGWGYGWGGPMIGDWDDGGAGWGGGFDNGGGWDTGQGMPSDTGGADFGGGWDAGGTDFGGGGGDFGGGDFGGGGDWS